MIRSMSFVSLAALVLVGCGPSEPAQSPAEAPVTPPASSPSPMPTPAQANVLTSEGFGPLRIGMTLGEVNAALGPDSDPGSVGGAEPAQCDQFRPERAPEGMLVMIEQGVLTRISLIRDSTVKTDRGLGLGDTAATVKTAYGAQATVTPHKYSAAPSEYITVWTRGGAATYVTDAAARGIVYEVGQEGTVQAIHAGGPSIQYVEGCS